MRYLGLLLLTTLTGCWHEYSAEEIKAAEKYCDSVGASEVVYNVCQVDGCARQVIKVRCSFKKGYLTNVPDTVFKGVAK